jgi:hypothetical protein
VQRLQFARILVENFRRVHTGQLTAMLSEGPVARRTSSDRGQQARGGYGQARSPKTHIVTGAGAPVCAISHRRKPGGNGRGLLGLLTACGVNSQSQASGTPPANSFCFSLMCCVGCRRTWGCQLGLHVFSFALRAVLAGAWSHTLVCRAKR